ncbi:MAG TPA: MDR family MFS transporter [Ktedonobacterales bacterium]|nr:MDR family MFS transporter [Ktedonobacterales bacterium]
MDTPTTAPRGAQGGGRSLHGTALVTVLVALMLTLLLEALDQTVVGTALPKIIGELNGFSLYTWVATAYLLASATVIPIVGKLSDQFGRKGFFITGVVVFLVGSAASGAAQTIQQLIAFRALQGLGAGIGISLVFTVVGDIFPPAERARWQGIFGAVYGISSVFGPTLGGWLTDHGPLVGGFITDASRWRWVFYVNLPIGIIALVALLIYLPANISARTSTLRGWPAIRRIDFLGAALASAATILLLLGLTWGGQTYPWQSGQVIGALVGSGVLFIIFVVAERFAAEPVLPLDLFKNRVFASASLLALLTGAVLLALVYYLPLFLQGVLGASATNSGEVITPMTVSLVIGSTVGGLLVARTGRYQWIAISGAVLICVGAFLFTRMDESTPLLQAGEFMVVAGLGLGLYFAILTLAVQNAIPRTRMGVGTSAVRYMQQAGNTLGVAVIGTVVNNAIASDIAGRLPAGAQRLTPAGLAAATDPRALVDPTYHATVIATAKQYAARAAVAQAQAAGKIPSGPAHDSVVAAIVQQAQTQTVQLLDQIFTALKHSMAVGIQHGFVAAFIIGLITLVVACFLKDVPLSRSFREEPAQPGTTAAPAAQETDAASVS